MCSNIARMCSSDLPTKEGTASRLSRSRVRPDSIQLLRASFLGLPNWSTRPIGCRVDKTSRIPARGKIRASSRSNRCIRSLSRSTVVANGLPRHQQREMRPTQPMHSQTMRTTQLPQRAPSPTPCRSMRTTANLCPMRQRRKTANQAILTTHSPAPSFPAYLLSTCLLPYKLHRRGLMTTTTMMSTDRRAPSTCRKRTSPSTSCRDSTRRLQRQRGLAGGRCSR